MFRAIVAMTLLFAASDLHSQTPEPAAGVLNPGDQIRISVWRKPEMSGDFTVGANGSLSHPLYREVQVTGIPIATVEERLRAFLVRFETSPQFVIQPLVKVIVGGEVRAPNVLSVPPETTIAQAVVMAGGPSERGLLTRVRVIRQGQTLPLDLSKPDATVSLLRVQSGDQIIVDRRSTGWREYIAPTASSVAAIAAIASLFIRQGNANNSGQ